MSKLRDQMAGAKTNEQYKAFQNEIAYASGEIRKAEDRILDFMEQSEPLDKNVKSGGSGADGRAETRRIREEDRAGTHGDRPGGAGASAGRSEGDCL